MIHITILYSVYAYHTVNRFHWNPMLDETAIDVDYQGDWNTIRAAPQLRNLERHSTVRSPKLAFPILVDQHFKREMLMAGHGTCIHFPCTAHEGMHQSMFADRVIRSLEGHLDQDDH